MQNHAKPIEEKKDDVHLFCMMDRTMEVMEKVELKLPDLPEKLP